MRSKRTPVLAMALWLVLPAFAWSQAQIVYVQGDVAVVRGSETTPADFGTPLVEGDLVRTGAGSAAIIQLNSQTTLKLRDNTQLVIESPVGAASVRLKNGGLFSRITGKLASGFSVRTDSVVAGVRGTEFFVAYGRKIEDQPDVWLCVNEGTVAVSVPDTGREVDVPAGKGINILNGDRLTDPKAYAWTQDLNWNMNPDAGTVRDTTNLDQAYADLLDQDYD